MLLNKGKNRIILTPKELFDIFEDTIFNLIDVLSIFVCFECHELRKVIIGSNPLKANI